MKAITILLILGLVAVGFTLQVSAAGPGYGNKNGGGLNLALPEPQNYNLSESEIAGLLFMREEEQMAHDLYVGWSAMYSLPVFGTIAQAEETHASEVQFLLDRYNISGVRIGNLSTGYESLVIQELSENLTEIGKISLIDALKAGVMIEEQDISDLDAAIAGTNREDLKVVYENLRSGSENHLAAFNNQLSRFPG